MSTDRGPTLLALARAAIGQQFGVQSRGAASEPWLAEPGATFVTLTLDGELRGCIGSLEAHRPLREDVKQNALAAAFRDPRFPPLTRQEFDRVRVEVSLLSPLEPIACEGEAQALAQLRPGTDGVVFAWNGHRSTFLPQVWESLPRPVDFLERLRQKAGLPGDFWAPDVKLWRYSVAKWREAERGASTWC